MSARALICILLFFLALGGCGGGGGEESTGASTAAAAEQAATSQGQAEAKADESKAAKPPTTQSPAEPNPPIATERTPGAKAVAPDVPVAKGGDNSVQAFGLEGEEEEAEQATSELKTYLDARANKDWAAACQAASQEFRSQLEALVERAKAKDGAQKPKDCPETLELLYGKTPASTLQEAAQVNRVLSFRVREDGYAYLIYEDGERATRFIAMANDDGTWRVNTPEPTSFPQTEEQGSTQ